MDEKMIRIEIGIPCYSFISSTFMGGAFQLLLENMPHYEMNICVNEQFGIDKSRNAIVDNAIENKCDYIFFLDTDIVLPPGGLKKLIDTAKQYDADMVTGVYFEKGKPHLPVLREYHTGGFWKIECIEFGKVFPVAGCGLGCALIKVEALKDLKKPFFKFSDEDWNGKAIQMSEDLYFCREMMFNSKKVLCDSSVICTHIGGGIDAFEYNSFKPILKQWQDDRTGYIENLMDFTNQTKDEVWIKFYKGEQSIKEEWNKINPQTNEEIKQFYKKTNNYLYDLGNWHFSSRRQFDIELVTAMNQIKPKKILDYGCGVGQNAFMIAREGFDVTCADLDSVTLDFAKFRFNKNNINAKFWKTDIEPTPNEKYDVILCFDVIEHLPKEEALQVITLLKSLLAENGKIYNTVNFGKTEIHPMHINLEPEVEEAIKTLR